MFICQERPQKHTHLQHDDARKVANRRCLVLDYVSANLQTADVTPEETQERLSWALSSRAQPQG